MTSLRDRRVLSPTTVGVVASGPDSSRGLRTLSGTPCSDAQVHHTTGAAASLVRASVDRPLAQSRAQDQNEEKTQPPKLPDQTSEEEEEEPARKKREKSKRKEREKSKRKEGEKSKRKEKAPYACPSFMERGSAIRSARRSAPFSAPPPFEAFREASRKGACPHSDRLMPCIHQLGASCPTPSLHTKRGGGFRWKNQAGKTPQALLEVFFSTCRTPAFSDPFQCGKGRSVVRGGRRSECGKWRRWWWWLW